jgi:hypothetical protein
MHGHRLTKELPQKNPFRRSTKYIISKDFTQASMTQEYRVAGPKKQFFAPCLLLAAD